MAKGTVTTLVRFLKEEFRKQGLKLNGIALFGSQLSGTADSESDIDLILISDEFKN